MLFSVCLLQIQASKLLVMFSFSMKGDVYPVEQSDEFTIKPVLDAHWGVLNDEDVRKI